MEEKSVSDSERSFNEYESEDPYILPSCCSLRNCKCKNVNLYSSSIISHENSYVFASSDVEETTVGKLLV